MTLRRSRRLNVAAARRRTLAATIDLGLLFAPSVALAELARAKPAQARRLAGSRLGRAAVRLAGPGGRESLRHRLERELIGVATAVAGRNVRSPGSRLAGVRRVDARTGGPVAVRGELALLAFRLASSALVDRLVGPRRERRMAEWRALEPRVEELRRRDEHDPEALARATSELYRNAGVNPFASCLLAVPHFALSLGLNVPAPWSPLKRSVRDRIGGTVVVVDR